MKDPFGKKKVGILSKKKNEEEKEIHREKASSWRLARGKRKKSLFQKTTSTKRRTARPFDGRRGRTKGELKSSEERRKREGGLEK